MEFAYDNGISCKSVMTKSDVQLQLDEWHYIVVSEYGHSGSLIINDRQLIHGQWFGTLVCLTLGGSLWMGGIDEATEQFLRSLNIVWLAIWN